MPYVDQVKKNNQTYDIYDSRIPAIPEASGSYTLAVVVTEGVPQFRWIPGSSPILPNAIVEGTNLIFNRGATIDLDELSLDEGIGETENTNLVIN